MKDRRSEILQKILSRTLTDPVTGCWLWQGPTSGENKGKRSERGHGYPRMNLDGQTVAVHKVVFTHYMGFIPSKKTLDHTCNNRLCVNISHLELVTHKENCRRRDKRKAD